MLRIVVAETEILSKEGSTLGDPVSVTIYGIWVTSLINMLLGILLNEYNANVNVMVWADDFSAAGNLHDLRRWWSVLIGSVPKLCYYP